MKRDVKFWGVFAAMMVSAFTAALDLTAISTALPVITNELHGTQFVWVGSAYALSSTAFIPMSGGAAEVFGRRLVMLSALFCFALGSALCGAAHTMNILIAGRTVQGLGAGGISSLIQIILSDLVPLRDRGAFNGLIAFSVIGSIGLTAIACPLGPVLGGILADHGAWRWLFYLNIFTSTFAAVLVISFLQLKTPTGTVREKLGRMDWIGNSIVITASSLLVLAVTWGGIQYPWSSPKVLIPLCAGMVGLAAFLLYEVKFAKHPIVPYSLMPTSTSLSGYLQTFIASVVMIDYLPVFFQACKGVSPTASGVDGFGLGFVSAPCNIIAGMSISRTKSYRPQLWLAWCLVMISAGVLSTLQADSNRAKYIGFEVLMGVALGILTTATYFPVLSPLPISENAHAIAFFIFTRAFGQVWGVTIGAAVLQNQLVDRLPKGFAGLFPQGMPIAYAVIPLISSLPADVAAETRQAFAGALTVMWQVMIGIGALGLVMSLPMKHMALHSDTEEKWGVAEDEGGSALKPETA
ncbi:iron permease [Mycena leptocephala]|nr:iron permease [Mycena leptocephala]